MKKKRYISSKMIKKYLKILKQLESRVPRTITISADKVNEYLVLSTRLLHSKSYCLPMRKTDLVMVITLRDRLRDKERRITSAIRLLRGDKRLASSRAAAINILRGAMSPRQLAATRAAASSLMKRMPPPIRNRHQKS